MGNKKEDNNAAVDTTDKNGKKKITKSKEYKEEKQEKPVPKVRKTSKLEKKTKTSTNTKIVKVKESTKQKPKTEKQESKNTPPVQPEELIKRISKNLGNIFSKDELNEVQKLIKDNENNELKTKIDKLKSCPKEEESPLIKKIKYEVLKHKENTGNLFYMLIDHLKENYNLYKFHFTEIFIYFFDFIEDKKIVKKSFIDAIQSLLSTIRKKSLKANFNSSLEKKVIKDLFNYIDSEEKMEINLEILTNFLKELCKENFDLKMENIFNIIDKDEYGFIDYDQIDNFLSPLIDYIENTASEMEDLSDFHALSNEHIVEIGHHLFMKKNKLFKTEFIIQYAKNKAINMIRDVLIKCESIIRRKIYEITEGEEDKSIVKGNKQLKTWYKEAEEIDNHKINFNKNEENSAVVNESVLDHSNEEELSDEEEITSDEKEDNSGNNKAGGLMKNPFTSFGINLQGGGYTSEDVDNNEEEEEDVDENPDKYSQQKRNTYIEDEEGEYSSNNSVKNSNKKRSLEGNNHSDESEKGYSSENSDENGEDEKIQLFKVSNQGSGNNEEEENSGEESEAYGTNNNNNPNSTGAFGLQAMGDKNNYSEDSEEEEREEIVNHVHEATGSSRSDLSEQNETIEGNQIIIQEKETENTKRTNTISSNNSMKEKINTDSLNKQGKEHISKRHSVEIKGTFSSESMKAYSVGGKVKVVPQRDSKEEPLDNNRRLSEIIYTENKKAKTFFKMQTFNAPKDSNDSMVREEEYESNQPSEYNNLNTVNIENLETMGVNNQNNPNNTSNYENEKGYLSNMGSGSNWPDEEDTPKFESIVAYQTNKYLSESLSNQQQTSQAYQNPSFCYPEKAVGVNSKLSNASTFYNKIENTNTNRKDNLTEKVKEKEKEKECEYRMSKGGHMSFKLKE
eukprot:CAMPEP_0170536750 /NCGR_PEP_ID=MMETSP0209-20121228/102321_1 /TAXON_ID=665100 ORGANISM="Litonotus pictus, Strain P1" /NCGR_SAMPLE_ID=MMETSP0209 /ASSEMBLY_ACC=CAM_ASM_000301 /LENGTH=904 /DNA_ID=CAMNT_0010838147 /DNA_START=274 /DNA_END=2992 /DNA_ORIENTATION=-